MSKKQIKILAGAATGVALAVIGYLIYMYVLMPASQM